MVLLWLGTCHFTEKKRRGNICLRGVTLAEVLYEVEEAVLYIQQRNSSVQVILPQCPVYSIKHWKNDRGFDGDYDLNVRQLEELIQIFNEIVDEKNDMSPPKFSMVLLKNTKTDKGKRSRYYYNYNLFTNAIHPSDYLAKLWLLRIKKTVLNSL